MWDEAPNQHVKVNDYFATFVNFMRLTQMAANRMKSIIADGRSMTAIGTPETI